MQIAKHWARVTEQTSFGPIEALGWSPTSQAEATAMAKRRARDIGDRLQADDGWLQNAYYGSDRTLREPVIDELFQDGRRIAAITRNVYGAYVLNTAGVMFVDMDITKPEPIGLLGRLLGKEPDPVRDDIPQRVADVTQKHGGLDVRLYETAAGYRGIITNRTFDPLGDDTRDLLAAFGSDKLYARLCAAQACFRARLSPKPWRIGMPVTPRTWPWNSPEKASAYESWSRQYEDRTGAYRVCRLVYDRQRHAIHPEVQAVLETHDALCCAGDGPLA